MIMKLKEQIIRFSFIGVLCFIIDIGTYVFMLYLNLDYILSGLIGYVLSLIVNYSLNMKYVFVKNTNMSKKIELITYILLSIIGIILNEVILYISYNFLVDFNRGILNNKRIEIISKVFSIGVTTIYNFISRKVIFDRKS